MRGMAHALSTFLTIALLLATIPFIPPTSAQGDGPEVLTWTKADSPIVLDTSYEVPEDTVLEIEAGVEVRLDQGAGIEARGELRANGTSEEPVRFVANGSGAVAPSMWGSIRLHGLPDDRDHEFRWAVFEGADTGLLLGSAWAFVNECTFDTCRYGIIARADSFLTVFNSTFVNNSAVGLDFEDGSNGSVWYCSFERNVVGVYLFEAPAPTVYYCDFVGNYHHLSFAVGSNATIAYCTLQDSIAEPFECYWNSSPVFFDVIVEDPDVPRVFLRDGCRPQMVGGSLATSLRVDGHDDESYIISMMRIDVLVRDEEGNGLPEAEFRIVGASGDVLFWQYTDADGRFHNARMANYTHSSSGGLDRENPQTVTVEWRGYVKTFHVDPRDLNTNGVLVLELRTGQSEPVDDLLIWILLMLAVVIISAGAAVAVRRRE